MNFDDLLKNDNEDFRFRPTDGVFRAKLIEVLIASESEEFADLFSESSSDILATICGKNVAEAIIRFQVFSDAGERSLECALSELVPLELKDLTEQLSNLDGTQSPPAVQLAPKTFLRKQTVENMLTIEAAAKQLNLSKLLVKSNIPCTDYTYTEIDGKIDIEEYFWSAELITRLSYIRKSGANAEDIKYIADECCHGDGVWAKELVGIFTQTSVSLQRDNAAQNDNRKEPARGTPSRNSNQRNRGKKAA